MFEIILILFVILESLTMGMSLSILMLANDELMDEAYEMGYQISNPSRILRTRCLNFKDKLLMSLIPLPVINVLAYFYVFYYKSSNNKELIINLIKNRDLVKMANECCKKI